MFNVHRFSGHNARLSFAQNAINVCRLQARNQLGTPKGAKSFLRGDQIF